MSCTSLNCSEEFLELATILMNVENLMLRKDPMERNPYLSLTDHINNLQEPSSKEQFGVYQ